MKKATIIEKSINELKEYDKNPRKNNGAVDYVANSIKEFGFKVPIIIDKNGTIVCGHTRYKAAKKLKLSTVPCIVADDLTDKQIDAFRLVDNKVSEKAEWDYELLLKESDGINGIDMEMFDFDTANELTSYIDDLLEESFVSKQLNNKVFTVTLNFKSDDKDEVKKFLLRKGKEALSDKVLEMATEAGA